jgi:hypothetical protein
LLFLDPSHSDRLALIRESHSEFIIGTRRRGMASGKTEIAIWSRSQDAVTGLKFPGDLVPTYYAIDGIDAVRGMRPPLQFLSDKTVLASVSEREGEPLLAFQLPEKPFATDDDLHEQHFVVSTKNPLERASETSTFWTPYVPELNEWYGRKISFPGRVARSEIDGVGIICPITKESLELSSTRELQLAAKLFELAGIDARPSLPGRIASRLISQLGGLQKCRVLKIAGVRQLIKQYGPLEHFDRTQAIRIIRNCDPATGQPDFVKHEGLFIEPRDIRTKLKPEHVFLYLLEKRVFRVGLNLKCPSCELDFWVHLDDVSTFVKCELCGKSFDISRQLKDRNWTYRRSGLFGRQNNQEGSIPVALTLQQLDTHLKPTLSGGALFLTNMSLTPTHGNIRPCETDIFVAVARGDRIQVAVGECKDAGGQIELDDARKLAAVADAFPRDRFDTYIVLSKTGAFTEQEIENASAAQGPGSPRVIMLSDRELEPYFLYERTSKEFDIRESAISLEQMARITHDVFFTPKRKPA